MLFSDYRFILYFLPACLALYFLSRRFAGARMATLMVTIASLVFYGWFKPIYILLIVGSVLFNFYIGKRISQAGRGAAGRWFLLVGVAANLLLLGYFKYTNFAIENIERIFNVPMEHFSILLPLGISFFTFQQIAYLADCRSGKAKEYSLLNYALFVTFFPQLIAGPIVHHSEMMSQYDEFAHKPFSPLEFSVGIVMFAIGLAKKFLADNLAGFSDPIFALSKEAAGMDMLTAWLGPVTFSFQIYFDFSGYTDMAIGLALLFGIRLPMNFHSPYRSGSIIEFWRRWHITLSRWLRDYLYIPLGGNRRGTVRRYGNLMVTMLLGGLWHGANWTFVIWGGLHGLYLLWNHFWRGRVTPLLPRALAVGRPYAVFSWAVTMLAVIVAWTFFRAENVSAAQVILQGMVSGYAEIPAYMHNYLGQLFPPEALAAIHPQSELRPFGGLRHLGLVGLCCVICFLMPNSHQLLAGYRPTFEQLLAPLPPEGHARIVRINAFWGVLCGVWIIGFALYQIVSRTKIPAFIYFNF